MFDLYGNKKYEVNVNNKFSGVELKNLFCNLSGINEEEYKLKFIFGGAEIKEEHFLYQFKLDNEYTIQIFKLKKE